MADSTLRFSQRHGHSPIKTSIQIESIDDDLRNALWSAAKLHFWDDVRDDGDFVRPSRRLSANGNERHQLFFERLWLNFYKLPLDTLQDEWARVCEYVRERFFSGAWYEVYDFIEFLVQSHPDQQASVDFIELVNDLLEREVSAYRFVDKRIVRITAPEEIEAIGAAVAGGENAVKEHLSRAMQLLTDRKAPDYRNSIKESISAVEALVHRVSGSDKGTLGDLLKTVAQRHSLHPALEGAFSKLYGYTSDAKGIRHALMDDARPTFEEAKFMLVACSAFTNYVRSMLKE